MPVRLGSQDIRAAVRPLVESFWVYPEVVHLLPDESGRRRALRRYLAADVCDAQRFDLLFGVERDGAVVGAATWLPPESYRPTPAWPKVWALWRDPDIG